MIKAGGNSKILQKIFTLYLGFYYLKLGLQLRRLQREGEMYICSAHATGEQCVPISPFYCRLSFHIPHYAQGPPDLCMLFKGICSGKRDQKISLPLILLCSWRFGSKSEGKHKKNVKYSIFYKLQLLYKSNMKQLLNAICCPFDLMWQWHRVHQLAVFCQVLDILAILLVSNQGIYSF